MKLVTAIVRPFQVEDIRDVLAANGISGLTATEVRGFGRQKGHTETYRGAEYAIDFLPKVRIEVACRDDKVDEVVAAIAAGARTGKVGDGKIFVTHLVAIVRVRTGETGDAAV
ncbi:MAG: P-II family nitrogen regulator [Pseudomonadota bacterium]